jgi:hypothetical protein
VYCYWAYGLGIHSEFPLFHLPVQAVNRNVVIVKERIKTSRTDGNAPYPYIHLSDREAIFSIAKVGRFRVSGGYQIGVDPEPNAEQNLVQSFLVGNALALLLYQRERLVLHASVISINGQGIAFLGDSGAGKSSIAAAFLARGHKFLVDDLASVDILAGAAWVDPGFPFIKLSDETKETLALTPEQLEFMGMVDDKASYRLNHLASKERVRLQQIYVVQPGEEIGLLHINSQQAIFELMRYSIPPSMVKLNHVAHFERCLELMNCAQIYGLRRPELLSRLPQLVDRVEENTKITAQSGETRLPA